MWRRRNLSGTSRGNGQPVRALAVEGGAPLGPAPVPARNDQQAMPRGRGTQVTST